MKDWLREQVFPKIVAYSRHPYHIAALILLGVALLVVSDTSFQLHGGNYLNAISAVTASILLFLSATNHEETHARLDDMRKRQITHQRNTEERLSRLLATLRRAGLEPPPPTSPPPPERPSDPPPERGDPGATGPVPLDLSSAALPSEQLPSSPPPSRRRISERK